MRLHYTIARLQFNFQTIVKTFSLWLQALSPTQASNLSKVSTEAVPSLKILAESRPVAIHRTQQHEVLYVVQFSIQEGADQFLVVVVGEAQVVPSGINETC